MATAGLGLGLRLVRGICKACAIALRDPAKRSIDFNATIRFNPMR